MPKNTTGRELAVATSATSAGDPFSWSMTQTAPTLCIHVPTFEVNWASHIARNVLR